MDNSDPFSVQITHNSAYISCYKIPGIREISRELDKNLKIEIFVVPNIDAKYVTSSKTELAITFFGMVGSFKTLSANYEYTRSNP